MFENSVTMLTVGGPTPVFEISLADYNGGRLKELVVAAYRRRRSRGALRYNARGAAPDTGGLDELTETKSLSVGAKRAHDAYRENFPMDERVDREAVCTHLHWTRHCFT